MRALITIAIIGLASGACAQGINDWSSGACFEGGIWWPARSPATCYAEDKLKFAQTMPPPGIDRSVTRGMVSITSHIPRCPEGWTLVDAGHVMCAKELREPE